MFELDDFIAEAMTSIVSGIKKGQEHEYGDHIAPLIQGEKRNDFGNFHVKNDSSNQATIVQFDVQVATELRNEKDSSGDAKVRLFVVNVGLGFTDQEASQKSNVHRLQFAIPLKIPQKVSRNIGS